jgi:hypothetical protein
MKKHYQNKQKQLKKIHLQRTNTKFQSTVIFWQTLFPNPPKGNKTPNVRSMTAIPFETTFNSS